jgi:hypothetical protein
MHHTIPAAPIILVTTAHPSLYHHTGPNGEDVHPRLGRLLQPRHTSSVELTAHAGIPWACDNDCFQGLDERRYVNMLDRVTGLPGCLFVTVPDVVADNDATLELFEQWAPELERRELPLALVAQDGLTHEQLRERAPRLACLFIGGSTEWKLGDEAAELARYASELGLFVHWGRVNTRRRFDTSSRRVPPTASTAASGRASATRTSTTGSRGSTTLRLRAATRSVSRARASTTRAASRVSRGA